MNSKGMHNKMIESITQSEIETDSVRHRNMSLYLHKDNQMQWWELVENCNDNISEKILSNLPYANCVDSSILYTFNEKLFPSSLSPYIGGG